MNQSTSPAAAAATAATSRAGSTPTAGAQVGSAVRRLREHAGLSLSEVARRSGVGKATLSRLEAGERNPTLDTLFAITTALQVPLGTLLEASGQRRTSGTAVDALLLDRHSTANWVAETYRLAIRPVRQLSNAHLSGTTETLVVVDGRVRTGPVADPIELEAGQSASFRADTPHLYQGIGTTATCLLVMISATAPARRPHTVHEPFSQRC